MTLLPLGTLTWVFIVVALSNQMICLERQSTDLVPRLRRDKQDLNEQEEFKQLLNILRGSFLVSQICFAIVLKVSFVH